jgi:hypothetical protein
MRLPGQSNEPGNPDSQIIPELALFASIIARENHELQAKKNPAEAGLILVHFQVCN